VEIKSPFFFFPANESIENSGTSLPFSSKMYEANLAGIKIELTYWSINLSGNKYNFTK
jgi:hypothetical protein